MEKLKQFKPCCQKAINEMLDGLEKRTQARYIAFAKISKPVREKMDGGDIGFMDGTNDVVDLVLLDIADLRK